MTKQIEIHGGNTIPLITLIVMAGIVFVVMSISGSQYAAEMEQAKQKTIQVCLQEGIDPECCRDPAACEEHECPETCEEHE